MSTPDSLRTEVGVLHAHCMLLRELHDPEAQDNLRAKIEGNILLIRTLLDAIVKEVWTEEEPKEDAG